MTFALTSPSTTDVSDRLNMQDCRADFERAERSNELVAFADFAEKWGRQLIEQIESPDDSDRLMSLEREIEGLEGDISAVETDLADTATNLSDLQNVVADAVKALRTIAPFHTSITEIADKLESA